MVHCCGGYEAGMFLQGALAHSMHIFYVVVEVDWNVYMDAEYNTYCIRNRRCAVSPTM